MAPRGQLEEEVLLLLFVCLRVDKAQRLTFDFLGPRPSSSTAIQVDGGQWREVLLPQ